MRLAVPFSAVALVSLQGAAGAALGAFAPPLYSLFALAVVLRSPVSSRLYAAFGLGLLLDLFLPGRTGAAALAFVLAAAAVGKATDSLFEGKSAAGRFGVSLLFLAVSTVAYTLFGDTSLAAPSAFDHLRADLLFSLAWAVSGVILLPLYYALIEPGGKNVTFLSSTRL